MGRRLMAPVLLSSVFLVAAFGCSNRSLNEFDTDTADSGGDGDGDGDGDDSESTGGFPMAVCGNGIVEYGEICDDANDDDDDGCKADCTNTKIVEIATAGGSTCARTEFDTLRCWGSAVLAGMPYPQDDEYDTRHPWTLADTEVGGPVAQLTAGGGHICALLRAGGVRCWGVNDEGQLGRGDDESPVDNSPLDNPLLFAQLDVVQIAASSNATCAVDAAGLVRCWGCNRFGELGYGDVEDRGDDESIDPDEVLLLPDPIVSVAGGDQHFCALNEAGQVFCWGRAHRHVLGYPGLWMFEHQGDDEPAGALGPVQVGETVVELAAGKSHTCVRVDSDQIKCWGHAWQGATGYGVSGDLSDDEHPAEYGYASGGARFDTIVASGTWSAINDSISCGIRNNELWCWGGNAHGWLGRGNTNEIGEFDLPTDHPPIPLGVGVTAVDAGTRHACAISTLGRVHCWGGPSGTGHDLEDPIGDDEPVTTVGPVRVFPGD